MTALPPDALRGDLRADTREALFRALVYLERAGAPPTPGGGDLATLRARGAEGERWLLAHPGREALERGYGAFVLTWSPFFPD